MRWRIRRTRPPRESGIDRRGLRVRAISGDSGVEVGGWELGGRVELVRLVALSGGFGAFRVGLDISPIHSSTEKKSIFEFHPNLTIFACSNCGLLIPAGRDFPLHPAYSSRIRRHLLHISQCRFRHLQLHLRLPLLDQSDSLVGISAPPPARLSPPCRQAKHNPTPARRHRSQDGRASADSVLSRHCTFSIHSVVAVPITIQRIHPLQHHSPAAP